jgi:hypothetical protein
MTARITDVSDDGRKAFTTGLATLVIPACAGHRNECDLRKVSLLVHMDIVGVRILERKCERGNVAGRPI